MNKPLIVLFVGLPGSGKTTFARQLAPLIDGVVLTSDAARLSMYKTREAVAEHRKTPEDKDFSNQIVFGALNYAIKQIVKARHSVIYDAILSYRSGRQEKYDMAKELGATVVAVRIKVPYEVSLRRIQEREATEDQRKFYEQKAIDILDFFARQLEEPTDDESIIYIDGEVPFESQYQSFVEGIARLHLS